MGIPNSADIKASERKTYYGATRLIPCQTCDTDVQAELVRGTIIYPNVKSMKQRAFWLCNHCGNYVSTRFKGRDRFHPNGPIPTEALRNAQREVNRVLGSLTENMKYDRSELNIRIANHLGREKFMSSWLRDVDEAIEVYGFLSTLVSNELREMVGQ